jgi:hypothetical protein
MRGIPFIKGGGSITALRERAVFSGNTHCTLTAFPGQTPDRQGMSGVVFPVDRMAL